MRPVEKGPSPRHYTQYKSALADLIACLGAYCSYCERHVQSSLAVEHVLAKATAPDLAVAWDNFLLACANCNSSKGTQVQQATDLMRYYFPHLDNTWLIFHYSETGLIEPNKQLSPQQQAIAAATLHLMGLNNNLRRNVQRQQTWQMAEEALSDYQAGSQLRTVVNLAKSSGFWSIWITVFQQYPVVIEALINAFPGTCILCLQSPKHARPRP
jgi:uncharacterized protein (TIGR02646 family)